MFGAFYIAQNGIASLEHNFPIGPFLSTSS
jgi:hypothetical protein